MLQGLDFISESELADWVNKHLDSEAVALSSGYQGKTLLYSENNHKLVIKVPLGNFIFRPVNLALLRHEYQIYQQLQGMQAVPVCYGMANKQFLVIEFIEGHTIREKRPETDSEYYIKLLSAIKEMHDRKVAHFDLKRMENLLVDKNNDPKIIDFGVSVLRKGGLHWLNQYLFKLAQQFDFNAWARHKYNKNMENLAQEDRQYYKKTAIEVASKRIKRFYKDKILKKLRNRA